MGRMRGAEGSTSCGVRVKSPRNPPPEEFSCQARSRFPHNEDNDDLQPGRMRWGCAKAVDATDQRSPARRIRAPQSFMSVAQLDVTLDRPLPQSPEAERAILGSILTNSSAFYRVVSI